MDKPHKPPMKGTWYELQIAPGRLTKLVVEGKAKVLTKDDRGCYVYQLIEDVPRRK